MNTRRSTTWLNQISFLVSIIILLGLSGLWRFQRFGDFPLNYDEGIHLIVGKLWAAGYAPYADIFVSYPPFFLWSLGIPWKLFNQAQALQSLMVAYALFGVASVIYLGTIYKSRLAGLIAGLLLSFTPAYFIASMEVMTEVPSVGLSVAAIALAEKHRRSSGWIWAALAGSVLAFGLSLKLLPVYAIPYVALLVSLRHLHLERWSTAVASWRASNRYIVRDLIILGGAFVVVFFLPLMLFDLSAFYTQVVAMRLVSREVQLNPFDSNSRAIIHFLFSQVGLIALALYGLVFVVARKFRQYWVLLIWLVLIWVSMDLHIPLRSKHLAIFLPILTLLAGFAVHHMVDFVRQARLQPRSLQTLALGFSIIITLGLTIWQIPQVIATNNGDIHNLNVNEERERAITFIDKIALPNDCVIADNPVFLHRTNRLPPPELAETSQTRIDTGHLTFEDLVTLIQRDQCHVVAVVTPRFGKSIPGLPEWLAQTYVALYPQDETFIYFGLKGNSTLFSNPVILPFDRGLTLNGSHLSSNEWHPAEAIYVSLLWTLNSTPSSLRHHQITIRSATTDEMIDQKTRAFFEGMVPVDRLPLQTPIRDTFRLDLPPTLPVGAYDLYLIPCPLEGSACLPSIEQTPYHIGQIRRSP